MKCETIPHKTMQFGELKAGETFQYSGNDYIRTNAPRSAIRLADGWCGTFEANTWVSPTPKSVFYREGPQ